MKLPYWGNVIQCNDDSITFRSLALQLAQTDATDGQTTFWCVPNTDICHAWSVPVSSDDADQTVRVIEETHELTCDINAESVSISFVQYSVVPLTRCIGTQNVLLCRTPTTSDQKCTRKFISQHRSDMKRRFESCELDLQFDKRAKPNNSDDDNADATRRVVSKALRRIL